MSKLMLRPEAGDVGKVKKFGDRPFWVIVSGVNRAWSADPGCTGSFAWPPRLPSAKPRLRDPVLMIQGAPPLRGEDLDRELWDTELDDSSCSGDKSGIASVGCERYGFGRPWRPLLLYGHVSGLVFLPLAKLERFLKNLDAFVYRSRTTNGQRETLGWSGLIAYLEQGRIRTDVCCGAAGIGMTRA